MVKNWIIFFLFYLTPHLFGCITITNIKKAKLERKPLTSSEIVASTLDSNGNAKIVFNFKDKKYSLRVPLDSIIRVFNSSGSLSYRNKDSTSDFSGVDFAERKYLILYKLSALHQMTDSTFAFKNDSAFNIYNSKIYVPNDLLDSTVHLDNTATSLKTIAFKYSLTDTTIAFRRNRSNYVIALIPEQKRVARYFLLPLTIPADAATLPFQALGYGFIALLAWAMKF